MTMKGKLIERVVRSGDKRMVLRREVGRGDADELVFIFDDDSWVKATLHGDCCSASYFDDLSALDAHRLVGSEMVSIEERDVGEPTEEYGDYVQHYALVITTNTETVSLMWRNESNGYYSGWLKLTSGVGDPFAGASEHRWFT